MISQSARLLCFWGGCSSNAHISWQVQILSPSTDCSLHSCKAGRPPKQALDLAGCCPPIPQETDSFLSHTLANLCSSVFTHPLGPVIMTAFSKSLLNLHCMRPQAWWTTRELLKDRNAQHIQSIRSFHRISHDVFEQYLSRASKSLQTTTISICSTNIQTT
jgi:hypothetical protein